MCMTTGCPQPPLPQGSIHAKLSSVLPPFCFNIWRSNYWGGLCVAPQRALTVTQLYRLCGAFICWQRYRRRSAEVSQGGGRRGAHAVERDSVLCALIYRCMTLTRTRAARRGQRPRGKKKKKNQKHLPDLTVWFAGKNVLTCDAAACSSLSGNE